MNRKNDKIDKIEIINITISVISLLFTLYFAFVANKVSNLSNQISTISNEIGFQSLLYSTQYTEPLVEIEVSSIFDNTWKDKKDNQEEEITDSTIFKYEHITNDLFTIDYGQMYWISPLVYHNHDNDDYVNVLDLSVDSTHFSAILGHTEGNTNSKDEREMYNKEGYLNIDHSVEGKISKRYQEILEIREAIESSGFIRNIRQSNYFIIQLFYHDSYGNNGTLNYIYQTVIGGGPNLLVKVSDDELIDYTQYLKDFNIKEGEEILSLYIENSFEVSDVEMVKGISYSHYGYYDLSRTIRKKFR